MWANDKKDGPGTFYYTTRRQKMEGQWLNDISKFGTLSSYDPEAEAPDSARSDRSNRARFEKDEKNAASTLPPLGLVDPEQVLQEQSEKLQQFREMRLQDGENVDGNGTESEYHGEEGEEGDGGDEGAYDE